MTLAVSEIDPADAIDPASGEGMAEAVLAPPILEAVKTEERTGPLLPMIIGAALFMQTLDSTVISNALPTMARSLHQDPVTLNLAITAYLLSAAVFLPISAWVADRFRGQERVPAGDHRVRLELPPLRRLPESGWSWWAPACCRGWRGR